MEVQRPGTDACVAEDFDGGHGGAGRSGGNLFARTADGMVLFSRLMQRGFSGGQKGRVSSAKNSPALSRLVTLHIPGEKEASLRTWMIYGDIKRTTGAKNVLEHVPRAVGVPGIPGVGVAGFEESIRRTRSS